MSDARNKLHALEERLRFFGFENCLEPFGQVKKTGELGDLKTEVKAVGGWQAKFHRIAHGLASGSRSLSKDEAGDGYKSGAKFLNSLGTVFIGNEEYAQAYTDLDHDGFLTPKMSEGFQKIFENIKRTGNDFELHIPEELDEPLKKSLESAKIMVSSVFNADNTKEMADLAEKTISSMTEKFSSIAKLKIRGISTPQLDHEHVRAPIPIGYNFKP